MCREIQLSFKEFDEKPQAIKKKTPTERAKSASNALALMVKSSSHINATIKSKLKRTKATTRMNISIPLQDALDLINAYENAINELSKD